MIRNSRQASVSRKTREELLRAAAQAPAGRKSSYLALADEIGRDLEEYEAIESGRVNVFNVQEVDDLGACLVKARLAKRWTHRQLAEALQVSEQMVQKDESKLYENAGLARLAEVADVLGYQLAGALQPAYLPRTEWKAAHTSVTLSTTLVKAAPFVVSEFTVGPTWTNMANAGTSVGRPFMADVMSSMFYRNPFSNVITGSALHTVPSSILAGADPQNDTLDSAATVPIEVSGVKS